MSRTNGLLVPDPSKWPNGIAAVATQIHGMGLKMGTSPNSRKWAKLTPIGLYGDSGTKTCSGYPGSQGYETADANTLAEWGIDLWKYDNVPLSYPYSSESIAKYSNFSATPPPPTLKPATPPCATHSKPAADQSTTPCVTGAKTAYGPGV
jgi:hypothetical protein